MNYLGWSANRILGAALVVAWLASALGCGGGGGGGGKGAQVDVKSERVAWLPPPAGKGETEAVVQFTTRDAKGRPLGSADVTVTLLLDGEPIDSESVIDTGSASLATNIRYALVLDASPSMVTPTRAPFDRMKAGAAASVLALENAWKDNSGRVDWTFSWFSEVINRPFGAKLDPGHLLKIPDPVSGDFTKLFAAVHQMATQLKDEYDSELYAYEERDHHVMVVFSDGKDNWSHVDNSNLPPVTGELAPGVRYQTTGYPKIDLAAVTDVIRSHPKLTVHVIALGDNVNEAELMAIAEAGGGRYLRGTTTDIETLFDQITREFTTIQTHGARMPLKPGEYEFSVEVRPRTGSRKPGGFAFRFRGGDADAGVIPRAPEILTAPIETATINRPYLHRIEIDAYPAVTTLAVTGLPNWLSFDRNRREIWGTPGAADQGTTGEIAIVARNGVEPDAEQKFTIDVGFTWAAIPSGVTTTLRAIWGLPGSIVTVGDGGTILRFDGKTIAPMKSASPNRIDSVWGAAASSIYAAGSGDIQHFDGSGWRRIIAGYSSDLHAVWGADKTDVFFAGESSALLHFNGTSIRFLSPGTTNDLFGLWGTSGRNLFAVGSGGLILRYDGAKFEKMISGTLNDLHAIAGLSGTDIFAVGKLGTVLRYDGKTWERMNSGTTTHLTAVWGSSSSDVFAVGENGTIIHFNGTSWKTMDSGTVKDLHGVWGSSRRSVFVVGASGTILTYGGI